ncbi:NAD-dependent epimerase/dehydratase family protein [Streptomyces doebereineriae]|uniref:UDP-glucose 4-epimerase n=1 Tax=Streptomyces doebereineriae TaxID=3075528 RepID=A0ABU2VBA9_9ACTN|nr:NAD-dependent epimerase/dehydratase family protein [Streptomyces sp. DSM 41640]MDT0482461.1 NAD-dependent epimerase/dehydratase family protein [Streptomyces sp. DSM 41640]
MRVLVTGSAGFIGSQIVEALVAHGHEPVLYDVRADPASDVRDPDAVRRALTGVDAVCHQAAMVGLGVDFADAPEYVSHNDLGTAVLLAAMAGAGVRRLVLAGSMVVYGEGRYTCARHGTVRPGPRAVADLDAGRFEPPCPVCGAALSPGLVGEDAPVDPRNVYATTKLTEEHLAASWARATGGSAVALRYHNVYGPGMPRDTPYAGVASFFRSALARGEAPRVFEDGCQRRDFVHVRDVAAANVAALEASSRGGALTSYNTGSGEPHTVGEMARALAGAHGGPEPVVTGEYRLGDVRHITADSARLRAELGWKAEVGFAEGMREFAGAGLRGA